MCAQKRPNRQSYVVDEQDSGIESDYVSPQQRHANLTSELKAFREWLQEVNSSHGSGSEADDADGAKKPKGKKRKVQTAKGKKKKSPENSVSESDDSGVSSPIPAKKKGKGTKKPAKIINDGPELSQSAPAASGFRVGVRF
jgi:hypothetical protein